LIREDNLEKISKVLDVFPVDQWICTHSTTALMYCATYGSRECLELILQKGAFINKQDNSGRTALHYACRSANNSCIEALLEAEADVDARTNGGMTPLMFAVESGKL
jgi:ankyrin repeat protein